MKQDAVVVKKVDAWKGVRCPSCGRMTSVSYVLNPTKREICLHGPGKHGTFCDGSGRRVIEIVDSVEVAA